MVRSPGFGSNPYNYGALFRLAFTAPTSNDLSSLHELTRWIVLQKARRHRTSRLRLFVRTQFQGLFHSPSGVLLTFPSRYLFAIDRKIYLALGGGPPGFSQGFTCPDLLDYRDDKVHNAWYTRLSLSMAPLSNGFYSRYEFLTLCRLMVAPAPYAAIPWDSRKRLSLSHNPLITFAYQLICLS